MKVQIMVPLSIALSVASFALIKIRIPQLAAEEKRNSVLDVKLRVTQELLGEFEKEKKMIDTRIEAEKKAQEPLQKEITGLATDSRKTELESCQGMKKTFTDEKTSVQEQINTFQAESTKEKTAWEAEMAALKGNLDTPSPICNYLKSGSSLPGVCPEKKEEPKQQEENKAEEVKDQPPKAEEPKPNAPKPEEGKADAPKPEAPKPEAPKPEAPKPEAPKPEAPKPEEPKPEAPKQ